ncbi:hypothetical protein BJF96_g1375 [Verticillium dahliae]|nr:hypothetical protein BJF96_g1375 [Verticillium dahliae]
MKRIYENADNVIIWLGPGSHETDTLFKMIQRLDKESAEISRRAPIDTWIARWSDLLYEGSRIPAWQLNMLRDALRETLARKWFERIWVIQEAYNAKTATVVCGYSAVRSRTFALMPAAMGIEPLLQQQALLAVMPGPLRWQNRKPESRSLKTLLQRFGDCQASDERDDIFALLGIASDASQDGILQPRYDLPMMTILRSTISYLVLGTVLDKSFQLPEWTFRDLCQRLHHLLEELFKWSLSHCHKLASILTNDNEHSILAFRQHPILRLLNMNKVATPDTALLTLDGVDVNVMYAGYLLLHMAVIVSHAELVRLICKDKRLDRAARDTNLLTALELAVKKNNVTIVKMLLSKHIAGRQLRHWDIRNSLETLLIIAAKQESTDCLELLLQTGAETDSGPGNDGRHSGWLRQWGT